jgi:hypothetical protein
MTVPARQKPVPCLNIGLEYEIKEIVDVINASIDEIGGLLYIMHNEFCGKGHLGFIQQLSNQAKMEWKSSSS